MGKTATITARIEPELKRNAETVLEKLGVNTTDAVTMFLSQVVLRRGLPFEVRLPNAATRAAMTELETGGGHKSAAATSEAFRRLLGKGKKPAK
ncbi:MAG: type II toxin-antitoxin system RelB/DinJ family antitoxin [Aestuariivirga sp.]